MRPKRWRSLRCAPSRSCALLALLVLLTPCLSIVSCKKKGQSERQNEPARGPQDALELVFTYGSEKEKWISEVTDQFNREGHRTASGKPIFVRAVPLGSGELIDEVLNGRRQPHIISPASAAFIKLGNAQSQQSTGHDLIASTDNLVL